MEDINDVIKGLESCTCLGCHHGCKYLNNGCNQFLKMDALELLTSQHEEIKRLETEQPKWIPISERLPDYDQDVLVYAAEKDNREDGTMIISRRYVMRIIPSSPGFDTWRTPQYFTSCYEITHWMPLPKPPKKDGGQE